MESIRFHLAIVKLRELIEKELGAEWTTCRL